MTLTQEQIDSAEAYRGMLRELRKMNADISTMPTEVQDAWLALHQNAQWVYWVQLQQRKETKMNSIETDDEGGKDALTNRSAQKFLGQPVAVFAHYFGLPMNIEKSSIPMRRNAAVIRAIKLKDAYNGRVHVLTTEGEWLISMPTPELGFVGLSASEHERREFWHEAYIEEQMPPIPGCSARKHGSWPCTCLNAEARRLGIEALEAYIEVVEGKSILIEESDVHPTKEIAELRKVIAYLQGDFENAQLPRTV